jgi:hypothetical protein
MFNWVRISAISILFALQLYGQSPSPTLSPAAKSPAPSPSASPMNEQIINSLGELDLQAALSLLKSNFTSPDALTEAELNRATLIGLLVRMPGGLMLLPSRESATAEPNSPFYSEIFEGHVGYLRLGGLNNANLKELDKKLQEFAQKKVDAVIVDLRAISASRPNSRNVSVRKGSLCSPSANRVRARIGNSAPIAIRRFKA